MSSDATPDPLDHPLVSGRRMQVLRTRRGISRTVLAGLLGMSPSWVKQIENGSQPYEPRSTPSHSPLIAKHRRPRT